MKRINSKSIVLFFMRYLGILFTIALMLVLIFAGVIAEVWMESGNENPFRSAVPAIVTVSALVVVAWIGISLLASWLTYKNYKWTLTDMGFKKESGVIFKRYVVIPYNKIQNVDIHRSLLHRILGLSAISIQTAGFSSGAAGRTQTAEGHLPGLLPEEAEKLQNDLLRRQSTHQK